MRAESEGLHEGPRGLHSQRWNKEQIPVPNKNPKFKLLQVYRILRILLRFSCPELVILQRFRFSNTTIISMSNHRSMRNHKYEISELFLFLLAICFWQMIKNVAFDQVIAVEAVD